MQSTTILYNEAYELVKKKSSTVKPPNYIRVGNGTVDRYKIESIDLLREMDNMSKAGRFLLLLIKDGITYSNGYNPVVRLIPKNCTSTEQQYIKAGYKELFAKDLVRRVRNGYYMINPNALIPPDYGNAIKVWNSCKSYTSNLDSV